MYIRVQVILVAGYAVRGTQLVIYTRVQVVLVAGKRYAVRRELNIQERKLF